MQSYDQTNLLGFDRAASSPSAAALQQEQKMVQQFVLLLYKCIRSSYHSMPLTIWIYEHFSLPFSDEYRMSKQKLSQEREKEKHFGSRGQTCTGCHVFICVTTSLSSVASFHPSYLGSTCGGSQHCNWGHHSMNIITVLLKASKNTILHFRFP